MIIIKIIYIIDKIKNLQKHMENPRNSSWIRSKTWKKHVEDPRTSSWIRSNNMTCSKQMLTTAPYFVCVYNKVYLFFLNKCIYIYIIDKIKNLQKHMENPRNSSWIRAKTWKRTSTQKRGNTTGKHNGNDGEYQESSYKK